MTYDKFGKGLGVKNSKNRSYWLERFNRKMSSRFPRVFPLISDRSVWHNESTPRSRVPGLWGSNTSLYGTVQNQSNFWVRGIYFIQYRLCTGKRSSYFYQVDKTRVTFAQCFSFYHGTGTGFLPFFRNKLPGLYQVSTQTDFFIHIHSQITILILLAVCLKFNFITFN